MIELIKFNTICYLAISKYILIYLSNRIFFNKNYWFILYFILTMKILGISVYHMLSNFLGRLNPSPIYFLVYRYVYPKHIIS